MSLADRLNRIIEEQKISKAEFGRRFGLTAQYVYFLTGNAKARPESIKPSLAKLIALEFGYDEEWILHGKEPEATAPVITARTCTGPLRAYGITIREKEVLTRFAEGKRIGQIAEEDGVTVNTVKYYLKQSYKKLNVHSRGELVALLNELDDTVEE